MLPLAAPSIGGQAVLCLGAHCDDIEIGCGSTILRLRQERPQVAIHWVVFASNEQRRAETLASAARFLGSVENVQVHAYRDGFLPCYMERVKEEFERLKQQLSPGLILTHTRHDLHQDHRLVCDLTWNTFRNHLILEYEVPKWDGDLGIPNVFVHVDEQLAREKTDILMDCYASQRSRDWFEPETFSALMRLRGLEANAPGRYAEAFYGRKVVLAL